MSLLVKRGCDEGFQPLGDVIKMWGRVPFAPGPSPPPLLVSIHIQSCTETQKSHSSSSTQGKGYILRGHCIYLLSITCIRNKIPCGVLVYGGSCGVIVDFNYFPGVL